MFYFVAGKKKKRAKSSRGSKSRHGNSSKGKRQRASNTKSGATPTATKVKSDSDSNGVKSKEILNGIAGLGAVLDASICKPVILHKPANQDRKNYSVSENVRRRENGETNKLTLKPASAKVITNNLTTKSVTLPQMSNNFMVKSDPVLRLSVGSEGLNSSRSFVQQIHKIHSNNSSEEITRITKVFLSDKHSGTVKDCGMEIPMAPPATPTPGEFSSTAFWDGEGLWDGDSHGPTSHTHTR